MFDADVEHEPMRISLCDMSGPMFDANIEREPMLRNMHINMNGPFVFHAD